MTSDASEARAKQKRLIIDGTLIEGVTEPEDWYGCKYTCASDGTFTAVEGWVDPRESE